MKKKTTLVIFLLSLCTIHLFAQDKILLISGKTIEGKVLFVGEDSITYQYQKKEKTRTGFVETYRVFSITNVNGQEKVIYKYDSLTANDRKEEELRNFIAGEQDAFSGYKPVFAIVSSLAISGVVAYFIYGSFFIIVVPFVTYMAHVMLYGTRIDQLSVRNIRLLANPDYIEGYKRIAKSKKNRNALWGSIIGAGVGFGAYLLSQNDSGF